jgi:poly(A)-specific ribonuclease
LKQKAPGYLNIPPNHGRPELDDVEILEPGLNRFHKRLVHQLVEIEYPSLRSIGRLTFVQIIQYDESREQDVRKARLRLIEERCLQHYGVRWIIEALVRGDLSKLDSNLFGALPFDPRSEKRRAALETAVKIKMKLKRNPPVLVGHNLFVDMVYLWQCFFGYLPERVEDFQSLLHENFPLLIDTKYLATHDCGDINPIASLDKIDESLKDAEKPKIGESTYIESQTSANLGTVSRQLLKTGLHEAGYDSYLTAKIFLKLASRLPKEHSIESLDTGRGSVDGSSTSQKVPGAYLDTSEEEDEEDSSTESPPDFAVDIDERNAFDEWGAPDGAPSYYPSDGSDIDVQSESEEESAEKDREILLKIAKGDLIPRFCSDVWKPYSNKLRVFGTNERVIILGDSEPSESSS